jgi:hypothetical protein
VPYLLQFLSALPQRSSVSSLAIAPENRIFSDHSIPGSMLHMYMIHPFYIGGMGVPSLSLLGELWLRVREIAVRAQPQIPSRPDVLQYDKNACMQAYRHKESVAPLPFVMRAARPSALRYTTGPYEPAR